MEAIGMIETKGLLAAIESADAMRRMSGFWNGPLSAGAW